MSSNQDQKVVTSTSKRVQNGDHSFHGTVERRIDALCLFIVELKARYSKLIKISLNMLAWRGEALRIVSLDLIDVNKITVGAAIEEMYTLLTELETERDRLILIEK